MFEGVHIFVISNNISPWPEWPVALAHLPVEDRRTVNHIPCIIYKLAVTLQWMKKRQAKSSTMQSQFNVQSCVSHDLIRHVIAATLRSDSQTQGTRSSTDITVPDTETTHCRDAKLHYTSWDVYGIVRSFPRTKSETMWPDIIKPHLLGPPNRWKLCYSMPLARISWSWHYLRNKLY